MCGIFGSFNFERYKKLYDENKQRGNFSYGCLYIKNRGEPGLAKHTYTRKVEGVVNLDENKQPYVSEYDQFMGHTRAPTSSNRDFSPVTSHPFDSVHYVVSHNGVLENHNELGKEYLAGWWREECVDSEVIPGLLSVHVEFDEKIILSHEDEESSKTEDVLTIERTCQDLRGTFGCWIYSKLTGDTFIVRSGSTLFGNIETGDFSSAFVPGVCEQELKQGIVYCVTVEGLAECGQFEPSNPFFL